MKHYLMATAVAMSLGSVTAFAQTTTTPTAPAPTTPPAMTTPSTTTTTSTGSMWYNHAADEMRASKVIGTKVRNAAGETIGDVNEIVLGHDGKIHAVVIGVGGFLGIGEREVAVNYNSLRFDRDANGNNVISMNATKEQLQSAPAWTWSNATSTTSTPATTKR